MVAEVNALRIRHQQAAALLVNLIRAIGQGFRIDVIKCHSGPLLIFLEESLADLWAINLPHKIDNFAGAGFVF